jgi:hypothetical protein
MPSLKCYQCGKVKRCQMYVRCPEGQPFSQTTAELSYLCRPCARALGYVHNPKPAQEPQS